MTDLHIRAMAADLHVRDGSDGRTLAGVLVPWGITARVLDRGRLVEEDFERGALADADPARIPLTALHPTDNQQLPIGRLVELAERDDGAWMAARVSKTTLGDEVLALVDDGVRLALSIGFMEVPGGSRWSADRRRVTRTRAAVDHVAIVRRGAYVGAEIVGVREQGSWPPDAYPLLSLARLRHG